MTPAAFRLRAGGKSEAPASARKHPGCGRQRPRRALVLCERRPLAAIGAPGRCDSWTRKRLPALDPQWAFRSNEAVTRGMLRRATQPRLAQISRAPAFRSVLCGGLTSQAGLALWWITEVTGKAYLARVRGLRFPLARRLSPRWELYEVNAPPAPRGRAPLADGAARFLGGGWHRQRTRQLPNISGP